MKNKFTKILSAVLIVTLLVSLFSVFAFAEDTGGSASSTEISHLLNRNFDEGWDVSNGLTVINNSNKIFVDYEQSSDYSYNYFTRFEAVNEKDAYVEINFKNAGQIQQENGSVIKISFKADDFTNVAGASDALGRIFYGRTGLSMDFSLLAILDGKIVAYTDKAATNYVELFELTNDWVDVVIVFDWDKADFNYTIYYGEDYSESTTVRYAYTNPLDKGLQYIRLGLPASVDAERIGSSFCIDDFQVYQNTKEILSDEELDALGYGQLVDPTVEKTIDIQSETGKSTVRILEESLCMKLGVDYALFKNEKRAIYTAEDGTVYGAPVKIDGEVMIPLELLLEYINFPVYIHADGVSYDITTGTSKTNLVAGRDSASVNGERVELSVAPGYVTTDGGNKYLAIATDDVELLFPGWLVTYDDMGLVIIYEDATPENSEDNVEIVNRNDNLDTMVNLMKKFIFDTVTEDENGNTLRDNEKYTQTGEKVYADVKLNTDGFKHPYIGTNQETFDKLNSIYAGTLDNAEAKSFLNTLVNKAEEFYKNNADLNEDGSYKEIKADKVPVNEYSDGVNPDDSNPDAVKDTKDGYDSVTGHLDSIIEYASDFLDLAFAYQVTRDDKYARLAYDWAIALGEWEHWGPGHFVDCAEATMYYSMAYDWLYNRFNELYGAEAVKNLAVIIFEKGVHQGYNASAGKTCSYISDKLGSVPSYAISNTNENAVCASGMIIASLAIMEYENVSDISKANDMTADAERNYLVGNNIINLANNGLDVYAPDGSYIESATYWEYGTNAFFKLVMALESAAGTDYGFMDTWGIETTCYYACHIESSDGKIWNYHEGGPDGVTNGELASLDTHMFNFAGYILGDAGLLSIRNQQLTRATNSKSVSIFDMLYFPFDGIKEKEELPLDYHMDGIDAFVARDSWEAGAMYTGLMGGVNNCNYGQIDSGNFIYHNKGIVWFMDLGSENYDAYGYFANARNNYYRCNAEGQNVLFLITAAKEANGTTDNAKHIKFGQYSQVGGDMVETFTNEHGSYAVLDNASVYYGNVVAAKRGILVTNDRKTVVIQDEVNFGVRVQDVTWVAHTAQSISISDDGKTAFLNAQGEDGNVYTLRATLITTSKDFKFSVISAATPILETTYGPTDSVALGGAAEYSRAGIQRLAIECKQAVRFNVAVVLELVENSSTKEPVGYEWVDISNWVPSVQESKSDVVVDETKRGEAKEIDIRNVTARAKTYFDDNVAFTDKLSEFYAALTTVEYTLAVFEVFDSGLEDDYYDYIDLLEAYELFSETANYTIENGFYFAGAFAGIVEEEYVEEEEPEEEEGDEEGEEDEEEDEEEGGEEEE